MRFSFMMVFILIVNCALIAAFIYLVILAMKALRKYIKSEPVRKEKKEAAKNLGEALKRHRTECRMTQEFVAETIGVSRQAVSKWESGLSDPNTSNLMMLAKLYKVAPEELLNEGCRADS